MTNRPKPVVLVVLDGWGHSEDPDHNAIMAAQTPRWDALWAQCDRTLIDTSGIDVGLPQGQMGNSEVGHLNLGSGRVVYQDLTRIEGAIEDGSFKDNPALCGAVDKATAVDGALHVMGLVSPGGVHSHEDQIIELIRLAAGRGAEEVYLHAILDGRDMPPKSALASLEKLDDVFHELGVGRIATICGRYYAMDRDKRWPRTEKAYRLYTESESEYRYDGSVDALEAAYARGETDEFVEPTQVGAAAPVADGDAIVFMNFRADRARQMCKAFRDDDFDDFERRRRPSLSDFVTLTRYHKDLDATVAFPPLEHHNVLGEYLSDLGLTQLRAAETEKYAHVTFFFNGGREQPFPGEDRALIPSPKVATYDQQPQMSAPELTDRLVEAVESGKYDVIICNFANADMVGHTGNFDATVQAIEALDYCIGRLADSVTGVGGAMLITADHGNAEQLIDHDTGQSHTAHTSNKVPLILVGRRMELAGDGVLADVAPTLLSLMALPQPAEMTGRSLVSVKETDSSCT